MTFPCEKYGRIHLGVNCLDCALVEQAEQRAYHRGYDIGYEAGRDAALTLAREAVAALWGNCYYECKDQALAAIDKLIQGNTSEMNISTSEQP